MGTAFALFDAALFRHLLDRMQSRQIPATQLALLAQWLDAEPDVPYQPITGRKP